MILFGLEVAFLPAAPIYNHHGHQSILNVLLLGGWGNYFFVSEFNPYSVGLAGYCSVESLGISLVMWATVHFNSSDIYK